jgi:hypothetical protein
MWDILSHVRVAREVSGDGACFTRAVSGSHFLPVSVFWVAVCVLLYIPPLYSQSTVLVAASNQVFLVLWAEIHYLCSLRWPTGFDFSPLAMCLYLLLLWLYHFSVPGYVLLWGCFLWNEIEEGTVFNKKKNWSKNSHVEWAIAVHSFIGGRNSP